jgi:hypothetical protein
MAIARVAANAGGIIGQRNKSISAKENIENMKNMKTMASIISVILSLSGEEGRQAAK